MLKIIVLPHILTCALLKLMSREKLSAKRKPWPKINNTQSMKCEHFQEIHNDYILILGMLARDLDIKTNSVLRCYPEVH